MLNVSAHLVDTAILVLIKIANLHEIISERRLTMDINSVKKAILDKLEADPHFVDQLRQDPVAALKSYISDSITPDDMEKLVGFALDHIPGLSNIAEELPAVGAAGLGLGDNGIPGVGNSSPGIPK